VGIEHPGKSHENPAVLVQGGAESGAPISANLGTDPGLFHFLTAAFHRTGATRSSAYAGNPDPDSPTLREWSITRATSLRVSGRPPGVIGLTAADSPAAGNSGRPVSH
jgi:hypothetical protein